MSLSDPELASTVLFCRSHANGTVAPLWHDSRDLELEGHFEIGLTVADRYFLKEFLGGGAMGRVFLANDLRLERPVAMKVVAHHCDNFADLEKNLEHEAKLGANLHHRGIAAVYDFGFHEDKSFTIYEYVEGETLLKLLRRRGRLPLEEALPIVHELAVALDFAHIRGVVHRDLKPANICFTKGGEFKILDFGLARDTRQEIEAGVYSGTPAYSSPEQSACRPTDGRSDQYALALIVFEMLTGQKAIAAGDPLSVLKQQINDHPPRPRDLVADLPESTEAAILQALSKEPADRFATCREFAAALGDVRASASHTLLTPAERRIGFYVSHVAEESLLARQIAAELEHKHFVTWYYGRDAIPGIPFSSQANAAIERSQAVLLLLSRPALRAGDLRREIEYAGQIGCPVLPLLVDLSREEFEQIAPVWRQLIGPSPMVEYRRNTAISPLLERLAASAEVLQITADREEQGTTRIDTPKVVGQTWATDANQIEIADLDKVLFRNDLIDSFLNSPHRHFISATKGFGKTLLLTCKRHLLTKAGATKKQAPMMVPEGRPYLDFMSEMRSVSSRYEEPLSEVSMTKRLWSAALRVSAISHFPAVIDKVEANELDVYPSLIRHWLGGVKIQPTVVFKELTTLGVGELNRLIDRTENFLDHNMRQIHGGAYFFIDKVDQAVRHLSQDAWIAVQAGLIEAAWELMNANSHLKVFASIRQEAFSNYQSDIKSNLFAATISLDYSDEDLHALFDQLAQCYEGLPDFTEFLGLKVIRHGRRPAPEDAFGYVRRHTCGRPRDMVAIASQVSSNRSTLNEARLRELVQQTCSDVVVSNLFDEMSVFLNCLGDRDARMRFLSQVPGNILERNVAIRLCEQFNGLEPGTLAHFADDSDAIYHPFRDLYFVGLLGVVHRDPESGMLVQRFRRPHDSVSPTAAELLDSPVLLIHPALDTFIRRQRIGSDFIQFQHIRVGENLVWQPYYTKLMQVESLLPRIDDRQFVELTHQVLKRIQALIDAGPHRLARVEIETSTEWKTLYAYESKDLCSEVLLWLEELLGEF